MLIPIGASLHPDGEEHLLKQLFGPMPVPDHAVNEREQPVGVAANQQVERPPVATGGQSGRCTQKKPKTKPS